MTASTSHPAGTPTAEGDSDAATVRVLLTVIVGSDLDAAMAVVGRQIYEPSPEVVVVGAEGEIPEGIVRYGTLEEAIADADEAIDYLWLLHSDARPRPDALSALVRELERNEAALGGSKLLVAGSRDELEEVGSATDVFGEPYSGLEEGEIDLQQYDVVREVAFVRSASMLARRDLAQGLGGLDDLLPPIAAGLDFSQRTRLAGGRVISVPSSEVYHQRRCRPKEGGGWREQAGRMRAMLTAYRPMTLLWVIPYDLIVSIADSIGNLALLRWRPLVRHLLSWVWNIFHLPSTIARRSRLNRVRVEGDEELFRFQAKGSVRLREVGAELSAKVLSLFDDDETLATRSRRFLASPGIWGAIVASLLALLAARSLIFSGMPNTGFAFPFESASTSLDRWFAGWNRSGLGSPAGVHPSGVITGVLSVLAFGFAETARTIFTILLALIGIAGMGRLGGRLGLRGPGRYLAGLVLLAGPGTALLTGAGSWLALAAAAFLPWAIRAVLVLPGSPPWQPIGWALVLGVVLTSFSPLLGVAPLCLALVVPFSGVWMTRLRVAAFGLLSALVAIPFLLGDPGWLTNTSRRLAVLPDLTWPLLVGAAALPLLLLADPWRRLGVLGAFISLAAMAALRIPKGGPGLEEALLIASSFGAALVVSAGFDLFTRQPKRLMALVAAGTVLIFAIGPFMSGRYGLPAGDINDDIGYTAVLVDETGPGRVLIASTVRSDIPGQARAGPGFWYRVVDSAPITHDQIWLPAPLGGDLALREALDQIARGDEIHPGRLLAPFAIDWVVLEGPDFRLDDVLVTQVDLVRRTFDPQTRVFENSVPQSLVGSPDTSWVRQRAGFVGEATPSVRIAMNHDGRWSPAPDPDAWAMSTSGVDGVVTYRGSAGDRVLALSSALVGLLGLALIGLGRMRR